MSSGTLEMSRDVSSYHNEGDALGIWWIKAKGAATHLAVNRRVSYTKELSYLKSHSSETGTP